MTTILTPRGEFAIRIHELLRVGAGLCACPLVTIIEALLRSLYAVGSGLRIKAGFFTMKMSSESSLFEFMNFYA